MINTDSPLFTFLLAIIIASVIFGKFFRKKARIQHGDHQATLVNPEYTPHPARNLSTQEKKILLKNTLHFSEIPFKEGKTSSYELFFYVAGIAMLGMLFFLSISRGELNFEILFYLMVIIVALIAIYHQRFNYMIDLRSPVFNTTGGLYTLTLRGTKYFFVKDIDITYFLNEKEVQLFEELEEGTLIALDYSPHSKFVWKIYTNKLT